MTTFILLLLLFVIITLISYRISEYLNRQSLVRAHLQRVAEREKIPGIFTFKEFVKLIFVYIEEEYTKLSKKLQLSKKRVKETSFLLSQAGMRSRNTLILYNNSRVFSPFIGMLFVYYIWHGLFGFVSTTQVDLFIAMLGMIIGHRAPVLWLKAKIEEYQNKIRKYVPDALELMIICVESGYSNDATIRRVAVEIVHECPEIAIELDIVATELKMLPSRHDAWENFYDRVNIPEVKAVVTAMQQSEKFGSPVAKSLRGSVKLMRRERMARAEKKAGRIPILMIAPLMVFFMPLTVVLILAPAYIRYTTGQ